MVQGNMIKEITPASSSTASFDRPRSPTGLEGFSRGRARRSSIVSACSLTSESSSDKDVDFGLASSITLQVERMLQVGLRPPPLPLTWCKWVCPHPCDVLQMSLPPPL